MTYIIIKHLDKWQLDNKMNHLTHAQNVKKLLIYVRFSIRLQELQEIVYYNKV